MEARTSFLKGKPGLGPGLPGMQKGGYFMTLLLIVVLLVVMCRFTGKVYFYIKRK